MTGRLGGDLFAQETSCRAPGRRKQGKPRKERKKIKNKKNEEERSCRKKENRKDKLPFDPHSFLTL